MHSTGYTLRFIIILTAVVALVLTALREVTKDQSDKNEEIFNKKEILKAIAPKLGPDGGAAVVKDFNDQKVEEIFDSKIKQLAINKAGEVVDKEAIVSAGYRGGKAIDIDMAKEKKKPEDQRMFPLFIYGTGKDAVYIMNVRGSGLWDEIWGNVAVKSNYSTIVGVSFDHKGETPGLGAEIKDNPAFPRSFEGKELYNDEGEFVSVTVRKGGARDKEHEVDGISGATVTADGVTEMLERGISYYQPYFEKQEAGSLQGYLINK